MSSLFSSPLAAFSPALMLGKALSPSQQTDATPPSGGAGGSLVDRAAAADQRRRATLPGLLYGNRGTLAQGAVGVPYGGAMLGGGR
jgi:hypothetical protein